MKKINVTNTNKNNKKEKVDIKLKENEKNNNKDNKPEKASIDLYIEFMDYYNKEDIENCNKILTKILKTETNNEKVKELIKLFEEETKNINKTINNKVIDDVKDNPKMKINKEGEYVYEDSEDEELSD